MSILNVFVTPELALIGVDTEAMLSDGSIKECTKVLFLPHIHAAVGFRGASLVHITTSGVIMFFHGSFDDLAGEMPKIVNHALSVARANAAAANTKPEDLEYFDFVLVGFSHNVGHMVGHTYTKSSDSPEIKVILNSPQVIAPRLPPEDLARLNIRADKNGIRALALDQCRYTRSLGRTDFHVGGHLFITEISRGSIVTKEDCSFPQ